MIGSILKKVIGSKNERELKKLQPLVARINELEPEVEKLEDHREELKEEKPSMKSYRRYLPQSERRQGGF
jgi:preprotein translocase subunit SecA